MNNILHFLQKLCVHNNREWFADNKHEYETCKAEFEEKVSSLITEISKFDSTIAGLTPKDCTYRIYRDTRFSDDKTPYKIHMAAYIAAGGKKVGTAGYYLHIEPDNSMLAGGLYLPPSDVLFQVRSLIYDHPQEFIDIIQEPTFVKLFGELDSDKKLKGMPRGFSKDFEYADLIKNTSYVVTHAISDDSIESKDMVLYSVEAFKALKEFNSFLNQAFGIK